MKINRLICFLTLALCYLNSLPIQANSPVKVEGVVFVDKNNNNILDKGESGLPGVAVSNGERIVLTDKDGKYELQIIEFQTVFPIKPSGYRFEMDEFGLSKAYYHYYPNGTSKMNGPGINPTGDLPESLDFAVYPQDEDENLKVALWGDTQAGGQVDWNHINKLVAEELILEGDVDFSILLGDITHDNVTIFPVAKQTMKHCNMPMHIVPGNHDRDYDVEKLPLDFTSFKEAFGPDVYAFNYAKTHFIVLNNIFTIIDKEAANTHSGYKGFIKESIMNFVEEDLRYVPEDFLVVFCQHIPLDNTRNYADLKELIKNRKHLLAVSAHNHLLHQRFLPMNEGRQLHEIITGATCGAWWTGELDYEGIPASRMACGTPKGYVFLEVEGNQYELRYKSSKQPAHKQMQIFVYEPNRWDWGMKIPESVNVNTVVVNVFTGSEKTRVLMRFDNGEWREMERKEMADPYMQRLKSLEYKGVHISEMTSPLAKPRNDNPHIWVADYPENISVGAHKVEIKTEDPHCQDLYGVRIFTFGGDDQ